MLDYENVKINVHSDDYFHYIDVLTEGNLVLTSRMHNFNDILTFSRILSVIDDAYENYRI